MSESDAHADSKTESNRPRWLWFVVKWTLCLLVLWFVGQRAIELWQEEDWSQVQFHLGWLVLAGFAYLAGWLPSVWFWRTMIHRVGGHVRFDDAARAYYCGHLGKYVPGKATVLVIRSALLKDRGAPVSVSILTATCETLMMMAVGAALGVALFPWLMGTEETANLPAWGRWLLAVPWLPGVLVAVGCIVFTPIIALLLTLMAGKFTPAGLLEGEEKVRITPGLVYRGLGAFTLSWILHGLSLGLTLRAVGDSMHWANWPVWTGGVAGATAIGFAALFTPGGLGVREGLLLEVLSVQPNVTPGQAVAGPLLLRAVWFISEICLAAVLYYCVREQSPNHSDTKSAEPKL